MYSRTTNEDATYDTRCLYCFMTIARSVKTETALHAVEKNHICPERLFAEMLAARGSVMAGAAMKDAQRPQ